MNEENDTKDVWKIVNWMNREAVVQVLENAGFACSDSEDTYSLKEALVENILDRTMDIEEILRS